MTIDSPNRKRILIACLIFIGILPYELNGFYNPWLQYSPGQFWTAQILAWVFLPVVIYAIGIRHKLFTNRDLGFHHSVAGKQNLALFLVSLVAVTLILRALFVAAILGRQILFPINYGAVDFSYKNLIPTNGLPRVSALLFFSLSAGIVEEMIYRGMFKRLFDDNESGNALFVIISSSVFASVHWEGGVQGLFLAFSYGIVASLAYAILKNIWPFILGHALNDLLWLMDPK